MGRDSKLENQVETEADLGAGDLRGQQQVAGSQYLIQVVFLQDNSLRRHPGYPRDGGRVIPVERKSEKRDSV